MYLKDKIFGSISEAKKIYLDDNLLSIENDSFNLKLKITKQESVIIMKSLSQFNQLEAFEYKGSSDDVSFDIPNTIKLLRCNKGQKINFDQLAENSNLENLLINEKLVDFDFYKLEKIIPKLKQLVISKCSKFEYQAIKRLISEYNASLQFYIYDVYDTEVTRY